MSLEDWKREFEGKNIGVYAAVTGFDYYSIQKENFSAVPYTMPGVAHSILANRLSYFFGWNGPSITIDTAFAINIKPLTFYNQNQLITFDGKLSKNSDDKFDVFIQNFKLSQLNPFLKDAKVTIDGSLTGNTSIFGLFGKPLISSDISFQGLKLNDKLIGYGEVKSEYNPEKEFVSINGFSAFAKDFDGNLMKNIVFQGAYQIGSIVTRYW